MKACKYYCASTMVKDTTAKSTLALKSRHTKDHKPIGTHAWKDTITKARKLVSALPRRNTRTKACEQKEAPANQCLKVVPSCCEV